MTSKNVAVLSSNKNESKQTKTNDDQTISNISNDDIGLGYFKELPCGNTTDAMVATIALQPSLKAMTDILSTLSHAPNDHGQKELKETAWQLDGDTQKERVRVPI